MSGPQSPWEQGAQRGRGAVSEKTVSAKIDLNPLPPWRTVFTVFVVGWTKYDLTEPDLTEPEVLKRNNPRFLFSPVICLLYEALWSWRNVVFTVYCTTTVHNLFFQQITDIGYQVLLIWGSLFQRSYSIWSRAQWGCKISNEIFEIDHCCGSSPRCGFPSTDLEALPQTPGSALFTLSAPVWLENCCSVFCLWFCR